MKIYISLMLLCFFLVVVIYQMDGTINFERSRYDEVKAKNAELDAEIEGYLETIKEFRSGEKILELESCNKVLLEELEWCKAGTTKYYCLTCGDEMIGLPDINVTEVE